MLPPMIVVVMPPDKRPTVGEVDDPDGDVDCNVVKTVNVFKGIADVDNVKEACIDVEVDVMGMDGVLEVIVTDVVVGLVIGNADVAAVDESEAVLLAMLVGSSEKKIGVGSPESLKADPLAGEQSQRPRS